MTRIAHTLAAATLAFALPGLSQAAPISGLYDTGAQLQPGTSIDANWALAGGTAYVSVSDATGFPFNHAGQPVGTRYWEGYSTGGASRWLHPAPDASTSLDPTVDGTYMYTLQFSLAGFDASTAWMHFDFLADDISQVYLNDQLIGGNTNLVGGSYGSAGFNTWTSLDTRTVAGAASYFSSGLNILRFAVTNGAQSDYNATGLRVHFLDSDVLAVINPVPEPGTLALLTLGAGLVGVGRRRRAVAPAPLPA